MLKLFTLLFLHPFKFIDDENKYKIMKQKIVWLSTENFFDINIQSPPMEPVKRNPVSEILCNKIPNMNKNEGTKEYNTTLKNKRNWGRWEGGDIFHIDFLTLLSVEQTGFFFTGKRKVSFFLNL